MERVRSAFSLWRLGFMVAAALAASLPAVAGTSFLSYTCNSNVTTSVCDSLNTTISSLYTGTFNNLNASIYITMGSTPLGESETARAEVSYSSYATALNTQATATGDTIEQSAVASLSNDTAAYGSGDVVVTDALAEALGLATASDLGGITAVGGGCTLGTTGCYNAIITISNSAPLYYRSGTETDSEYDFYSVVEHETDEVLGTASCIQTGGPLTDGCGGTTPSAVDLFRYNGGTLVTTAAAVGQPSLPGGAYFSFDGGATNGANGFVYNTVANGDDYADFNSSCPGGPFTIQDAAACPGPVSSGGDGSQDITNDGGAEINILNAVGFDIQAGVPEPSTFLLVGVALLGTALRKRKAK